MLDKCDIYLTSTYFKGTKVYKSFEELPNRRGYGIVIFKINVRYQIFLIKLINLRMIL